MDFQTLSMRISECLDDLGLLLDQIYKFPQKQREAYFDKIHSLKNKLLMLKSTLRQNAPQTSEKQYKQLYLAMNALKNELTLQMSAITVTKQTRETHTRVRDAKQTKRNYDDALRVIVQREAELRMLRLQLTQKEQIIHNTFSEMTNMKSDLQILLQENRRLKYEQTTLQLELDSVRAAIDRNSDTAIQFRTREQEKDLSFVTAIEELERLKIELLNANQKLSHFQQLAQVSMRKTKKVQENIKKVERQAQDLNENYRIKESDNFRKLKQIGELQFELGMQFDQNRLLQLQNCRLKQDIQVLQSQVIKGNKNHTEKMVQTAQQRQRLHQQVKRVVCELETAVLRETELKRLVQQAEKKNISIAGKLNLAEETKVRNKELQIKIQSLEQRLKRTQSMLEQSKRQSIRLLQEKQRISQQLEFQIRANRQSQMEVFKVRQKTKLKEQQRTRLIEQLELLRTKLKESQRALAIQEVAKEALELQFAEEKGKTAKGQEKHRIKQKQIQGLKVKLLHAKIQTVHEIRQVISG